MSPTSFMSEHTAEYALVPDLVAQLAERFPTIIPLYFWATREGSRVGRESLIDAPVRVVAAFARRPKVFDPGDERILVKINDVLFAAAQAGEQVGIPVLAGVPLVNSLVEFSTGVRCAWFHIAATPSSAWEAEFWIPVSGEEGINHLELPQGVAGPLTGADVVDAVDSQCRDLCWEEALYAMRHVKSAGGYQHPLFGGGYRPFFLMMVQGNDARN
ncbi:MAG: hypothetical protein HQ559_13675 [Lentisphaerae bacterium]|nr:hypothetical protein [Lentisphaerota bacterium]